MSEEPLRSVFTEIGGMRIHARTSVPARDRARAARSAAPTAPASIVLVHGIGVSSRYLIPCASRLSVSADVWLPDLPGFGRSTRPAEVLDVAAQARVLSAWLSAVDLPTAHLLGNSFGCQVLVELAATRPHQVASLVLVGPTIDPAARTMRQQTLRYLADVVREPLALLPVALRDYLSCSPRRLLTTLRHALAHHIERRLPAVAAPTLVVRGARDPIAPRRWVEEAASLAPKGRAAVIPGAAHAAHFAAPAALARLVRGFVETITTGAAGETSA